jgi:hypothetical protein
LKSYKREQDGVFAYKNIGASTLILTGKIFDWMKEIGILFKWGIHPQTPEPIFMVCNVPLASTQFSTSQSIKIG